ncbi:MAG: polyphosphate kinase 2 [Magnetococcales bacterium]|nr:polyphosphate kinase 2 [Magnetococcales bacterium]
MGQDNGLPYTLNHNPMKDLEAIELGAGHARANQAPRATTKKLKRIPYEETMHPLRIELLKAQNWIRENDLRVMCIYEGRDAGGKGGTLKRFIEFLNPRSVNVVALDKPTDIERTQWYFQRYVKHLPHAGQWVFFDRSWYNRAVVERVMGFCEKDQTREFLRFVPEYERSLVNSGIIVFKFWFSVSKEEQLFRFNRRLTNPLKQWKLSPVDKDSQGVWDVYTEAKDDMFWYTDTPWAPWTIIKSDDKKRARINCIRYFLSQVDYPDKDESLLKYDSQIVRTVPEEMNWTK